MNSRIVPTNDPTWLRATTLRTRMKIVVRLHSTSPFTLPPASEHERLKRGITPRASTRSESPSVNRFRVVHGTDNPGTPTVPEVRSFLNGTRAVKSADSNLVSGTA